MERGQMATGFFLVVHDEFTGKPRISSDLLLCGLVGAQIADLVVGGRLTMSGDRVALVRPEVSGLDELGTFVLDSVSHEPEAHTVRSWNDALGEILHDLTVGRLTADQVLRKETSRGLLGKRKARYPAVDLVRARRPTVELREMFDDPRRFNLPGAFIASMLSTLEVEAVLEPEIDRGTVRTIAAQAAEHLPGSLSQLRAGLADTVAAISLTVRR
ncbi:Golgi phosphoprotein 3 GPP34 [Pseudonocardia endophytica]|uniref:Golgi phosphoprotein 3 GPP34 n=2 Tax=Pseudonocardia endophytica TaxID=401976 RepID=A0A4R1HYH1_PSEEN|nr:Golgi phosphoprotein 3 GPP34 [Pseudonocardia endophytica]